MIVPGSVVRDARKAAGLTQAELADRLHTSQSVVARLESPRSNPRFETFQRALAATGNRIELSLEPQGFPSVDETLIVSNLRFPPGDRLRRFTAAYHNLRELAPTRRGRLGP